MAAVPRAGRRAAAGANAPSAAEAAAIVGHTTPSTFLQPPTSPALSTGLGSSMPINLQDGNDRPPLSGSAAVAFASPSTDTLLSPSAPAYQFTSIASDGASSGAEHGSMGALGAQSNILSGPIVSPVIAGRRGGTPAAGRRGDGSTALSSAAGTPMLSANPSMAGSTQIPTQLPASIQRLGAFEVGSRSSSAAIPAQRASAAGTKDDDLDFLNDEPLSPLQSAGVAGHATNSASTAVPRRSTVVSFVRSSDAESQGAVSGGTSRAVTPSVKHEEPEDPFAFEDETAATRSVPSRGRSPTGPPGKPIPAEEVDDIDALFGGDAAREPATRNSAPGARAAASRPPSPSKQLLLKEIEDLKAAAAKPKSLERIHAELLAELHEAEAQLLKQRLAVNAADSELRRSRERNAVAESAKRVDLVRQQGTADTTMREASSYSKRRIADASSKGDRELAEMVESHSRLLKDRNDRLMSDLKADIKLNESEIAKLEGQKELLLKNGSFEPAAAIKAATTPQPAARDTKATYVRLADAKSVDAKVQVALKMLMEHHADLDAKVEKKVASMIHLESSALINDTWEERHRMFVKESIGRRDAFSQFKTELVNDTAKFHAVRHDHRKADVGGLQELVKKGIGEVRERTIAVTDRTEAECRAQFEELSATFRSQFAQSVAGKDIYHKALLSEDEKVYAAQKAEAASRHQLSTRLQVKLQADEVESIRTVLSKELERSAALNGPSTTQISHMVGHQSQDAEENMSLVKELMRKVTHAVEKQIERNHAFKATGADSTPADTAAFGPGSGSPLMPLSGLTPDEAHLVSLFAEKRAVLLAVHSTVKDQINQLGAARDGLGSMLEAFDVQLTQLMREVHDGRLQHQTTVAKSEATRAQWEREHRAMLSHKNVKGGPDSEVQDVYGLYPTLGIALQLATTVRNAAVAQQERFDSFTERRALMLQSQRQADAASAEDGASVQHMWERLVGAVLKLNDESRTVTERQLAVLSEQAKLGVEQELLANEQRTLAQRAAGLERTSKEVATEYHRAQQGSQETQVQSRQLEREQEEANKELRTLVLLQGDLRHQQADHYAQATRLERMKQRLMGVWGSESFHGGGGGITADGSIIASTSTDSYNYYGGYGAVNTTNTRYPRPGDENYHYPTTTTSSSSGALPQRSSSNTDGERGVLKNTTNRTAPGHAHYGGMLRSPLEEDEDDEATDAYDESHPNPNKSEQGYNTSAFTQLRHVSPSMATSASQSLDATPRR